MMAVILFDKKKNHAEALCLSKFENNLAKMTKFTELCLFQRSRFYWDVCNLGNANCEGARKLKHL